MVPARAGISSSSKVAAITSAKDIFIGNPFVHAQLKPSRILRLSLPWSAGDAICFPSPSARAAPGRNEFRISFQGRGNSIRPLPEHCWQRAGNIFRPGWAGCLTGWNPVPSHAEHSTSATARFRFGLFMKFSSLECETPFASSCETDRLSRFSIGG
jgi:hypothetical protein